WKLIEGIACESPSTSSYAAPNAAPDCTLERTDPHTVCRFHLPRGVRSVGPSQQRYSQRKIPSSTATRTSKRINGTIADPLTSGGTGPHCGREPCGRGTESRTVSTETGTCRHSFF